jgi:hypothetical protein
VWGERVDDVSTGKGKVRKDNSFLTGLFRVNKVADERIPSTYLTDAPDRASSERSTTTTPPSTRPLH